MWKQLGCFSRRMLISTYVMGYVSYSKCCALSGYSIQYSILVFTVGDMFSQPVTEVAYFSVFLPNDTPQVAIVHL